MKATHVCRHCNKVFKRSFEIDVPNDRCDLCHDEMEVTWPEDRMDAVGQNGPTADHYAPPEFNPVTSSLTDSQQRELAIEQGECSDGTQCGTFSGTAYCDECPNAPHVRDAERLDAQFNDAMQRAQASAGPLDTGAHYRYQYRVNLTPADIERGYAMVNLDPYRIADIYQLGGGPREHIVKKGLRGTSKGDTERMLVKQLRDALDRWDQMLSEDGAP